MCSQAVPRLDMLIKRLFRTQLCCRWQMNMINVLWCRFQQCLDIFTISLLEASSETVLFRHLSDYIFRVRNFENTKSMRVIFLLKIFKCESRFQSYCKNLRKGFCCRHNFIWIRIVKLFLLRTGYFLSVANVLTRYPQIWNGNKGDFFEQNSLASDQWVWYSCCDADFNTVWARLPYCFSKLPLKRDFLDIYLTTILKSVTSKI